MNSQTTKGLICLKDNFDIEYSICEIEYTVWESEEFEYRFRPIYSVIDLLDTSLFQGIPGIDLSERKPEYIRKNIVPTFISERSPSRNREELWRLLEECNMEYFNQLEWLIRTDTQYSGDRLYVKNSLSSYEEDITFKGLKRNADIQKRLLTYICAGRSFTYEGFEINDSNRSVCYELLNRLYRKESERLKKLQVDGVRKAKKEKKYSGRKKIHIDGLAFDEIYHKYKNKQITANVAAKKLGISLRTFYRRISDTK